MCCRHLTLRLTTVKSWIDWDQLTEILRAIDYVQGIPSERDSMFDCSVNNLIILDNMMDEATQDK